MQKVEGIVDEAIAAARLQIRHQSVHVAMTIAILHDDFTVQHDGVHGQSLHGGGNVGEAGRPVVTVPGQQDRLQTFQVGLDPVAIELDLVDPSLTGRGEIPQRWLAGLNEARLGSGPGTRKHPCQES